MPRPTASNLSAMGGPALLVGAHLMLLGVHDLAAHPWSTLAALGLGFAGLGWSVAAPERIRLKASGVLLVALALRLTLLPLPATLSDDVMRYLWDGKVALAGFDPYAVTPDAEELAGLRDERWAAMPHRDVEAVYPPLALALFSIAAALPAPLLAWKLMLVAAEIAGCVLLLRLAERLGVPPSRVALYAWNPLVTLEIAGMGHVDGLGVPLVAATVLALLSGRRWAPAAAAASVLAKVAPIVALPVWARRAPRALPFAAAALGLVALGLLPVLAAAGGVPPGWVRFGVSWEFNGPLYEPLWRLLDRGGVDHAVKSGLDAVKSWTGAHDLWNRFYPWIYPQLMAKGLLAVLLAVLLWRVWRQRRPEVATATGRSFAALLLCSATVYPWYLIWVLPWAALARHRAWLALSALLMLSYLPQVTALPLIPGVFAAIWVPFFVLLGRHRSWSID